MFFNVCTRSGMGFLYFYAKHISCLGFFFFFVIFLFVFLFSKKKKSMSRADSRFGFALGSMFVNERFAGNSREIATGMIQDIKTAFKEGLASLEWMDEATAGFFFFVCLLMCYFAGIFFFTIISLLSLSLSLGLL